MKFIIKGGPKEIADLFLALQGQRSREIEMEIDGKALAKTVCEAIRDTHEE